MKLPKPQASSEGNFFPYLKASDLSKSGKSVLSILGNARESSSEFGDGIDIEVKLGAKSYTWTVKFASGNYRRLYESYGDNPDRWKGKKVKVERGEFRGNEYVKIAD